MDLKGLTAYITKKLGCTHPYRVSRILVLLNWLSDERLGKMVVPLRIKGFEAAFYVEELKDIFNDECFKKDESLKCFTYECNEPELPEDIRGLIDELVERTKSLSNKELNRLVIKDPRYRSLIKGERS